MTKRDYEAASDIIKKSSSADFVGERHEKLICAAENALGIRFPNLYRRFVSEFGAGDIDGNEFYGILSEDFVHSSVPDAVWKTLELRKEAGLSNRYIVVCEFGDGTYCAVDTSRHSAEGDAPIVLLSINGDYVEDIAIDFGEFLLKMVGAEIT